VCTEFKFKDSNGAWKLSVDPKQLQELVFSGFALQNKELLSDTTDFTVSPFTVSPHKFSVFKFTPAKSFFGFSTPNWESIGNLLKTMAGSNQQIKQLKCPGTQFSVSQFFESLFDVNVVNSETGLMKSQEIWSYFSFDLSEEVVAQFFGWYIESTTIPGYFKYFHALMFHHNALAQLQRNAGRHTFPAFDRYKELLLRTPSPFKENQDPWIAMARKASHKLNSKTSDNKFWQGTENYRTQYLGICRRYWANVLVEELLSSPTPIQESSCPDVKIILSQLEPSENPNPNPNNVLEMIPPNCYPGLTKTLMTQLLSRVQEFDAQFPLYFKAFDQQYRISNQFYSKRCSSINKEDIVAEQVIVDRVDVVKSKGYEETINADGDKRNVEPVRKLRTVTLFKTAVMQLKREAHSMALDIMNSVRFSSFFPGYLKYPALLSAK